MSNHSLIIIFTILFKSIVNIHCGNNTQYNVTDTRKDVKDVATSLSEIEEDFVKTELIERNTTGNTNGASEVKYHEVGVTTDNNELYNVCPYFKLNKFSTDTMVDVWQTVFYQAKEKVPCFKILIRKLNITERRANAHRYGNFNNKVLWDNCTLEIKADISRKHFLQVTPVANGIFQNIIIEIGNKTKLVTESPDQWFVQKNLLLLKDCGTGDVVVFARVPFMPTRNIITEGLNTIGASTDGNWTCDEPSLPHDKDVEFEIFGDMTEFM